MMTRINIERRIAIEQLTLTLGALPTPKNWNLVAIAEKLANDLTVCSDNQKKRKALGVKAS